MADYTGTYSGKPAYYLLLRVNGNAPTVSWELWAIKTSGTGYYALDCFTWNVSIFGSGYSGCHNLDFRNGVTQVLLANGNAPAAGTGSVAANHLNASVFGSAYAGGSYTASTVPPAPNINCVTPNPDQITATSMRIRFCSSGDGGSAITGWSLQRATDAAFTQNVTWMSSSGTTIDTGLTPNTTYYYRAFGSNAVGNSGPSATVSGTTLTPGAATLDSVTPSATGTSATVAMTPPAGYTAQSYIIQNRSPGGTWATVASGSANPSQVVTGLTPGQTYEWRVQAVVSGYTTAVSNVKTATQPQPNASPGTFWDGDTPDTPTTNYGWTGTAGASTATAQTLTGGAVGWLTGAQAVSKGAGGSAVQYQIAGGIEPNNNGGAWSVRYVILTGAAGNGFRAGLNGSVGYAVVTQGGKYMGSIHVKSSRARTLAAMWVWYNNAGTEIGTSPGVGVAVGTGVARLTVLGTAPSGAVKGAIVVTDPAGSSMMTAGDTLTVDAAMGSTGVLYPYFDGNTPDTAQHVYSWLSTPNNSVSMREDIPQSEQNPLWDPDCPPLPTPPQPPAIEDDCITPVGSWRRAWYIVDASSVPAYLTAVPTVELETFGYAESQVRIRWYANPDNIDPLSFDSSTWDYEQIVTYIPPCTVLTIDGVSERAWAQVGARTGAGTAGDPYVCVPGDYPLIPADNLLRGTGGVPATWPVLSCGSGWLISLDTPLDAPVGNLSVDAGLTVRE